MADGTSVPVGVMSPAMAGSRRRSSLKRFTQQRSTIAFFLCLPLILLVAGLVVYPAFYAIWLSMLNKKMTAFVGLNNFAFLLKRNTFQLVIFQSCLFAVTSVIFKALFGIILAHLMHNIPGKNQRIWRGLLLVPWVIPLALSTLTWWWMFDPSYSAFNWLLNQFGTRFGALARRGLDRPVLHHHGERLVRYAILHDHVSRRPQVGAGAAL